MEKTTSSVWRTTSEGYPKNKIPDSDGRNSNSAFSLSFPPFLILFQSPGQPLHDGKDEPATFVFRPQPFFCCCESRALRVALTRSFMISGFITNSRIPRPFAFSSEIDSLKPALTRARERKNFVLKKLPNSGLLYSFSRKFAQTCCLPFPSMKGRGPIRPENGRWP